MMDILLGVAAVGFLLAGGAMIYMVVTDIAPFCGCDQCEGKRLARRRK